MSSATECPKCRVRLQDIGTPVPWCDRCAWTPPGTEWVDVPLPDAEDEDRLYESGAVEVPLEPERFAGDADAAYYRRVRLPDQDDRPLRAAIEYAPRVTRRFRGHWLEKKLDEAANGRRAERGVG